MLTKEAYDFFFVPFIVNCNVMKCKNKGPFKNKPINKTLRSLINKMTNIEISIYSNRNLVSCHDIAARIVLVMCCNCYCKRNYCRFLIY